MHLVDSLMLQLYTILARLEASSTEGERSQTVGDVSDAVVGVSLVGGNIDDILLFLPIKDGEVNEDGQLNSLSIVQSFCLQVFLIRFARLITNNDELLLSANGGQRPSASQRRTAPGKHYWSLGQRVQQFSSMKELGAIFATDIFRMTREPSDLTIIEEDINTWFEQRRSGRQLLDRFYRPPAVDTSKVSFSGGHMIDYLETLVSIDGANPALAFNVINKEIKDNY